MESTVAILNTIGASTVQAVKGDLQALSATGKTVRSVRYQVSSPSPSIDRLVIYARAFTQVLESGRGPRKSSQESNFQDNMDEWVNIRFPSLPDKKKKQLAKYLRWKINKQGDKTHRQGGKQVYSQTLIKAAEAIRAAVTKDFKIKFSNFVKNAAHGNNSS